MSISWLVSICGGMCVILALVKTDSTQMKPYGPKMCEQFCDIDNCSSQFSFTLLSCSVTFASSCEDTKRYVDNCIIQSREKHEGNFKTRDSKMKMAAEKRTRLLVAPHDEKDPFFYVLNVGKNQLDKYPKVEDDVTALAYASKLGKVIFGTQRTNTLYAITLGQGTPIVLKREINTFGLAIDEDSQDVFVSGCISLSRNEVGRMTISNRSYKGIINITPDFPWSLALDNYRKIIYVSIRKCIMVITYKGKELRRFSAGGTSALALGEHILFYNKDAELFVRNITSNTSMSIGPLPYTPIAFALGANLYMSSLTENHLYYYHFQTKTLLKIQKIHSKGDAPICLIP